MSPTMQAAGKIAFAAALCALVGGCAFFHPMRESSFAVRGRVLVNSAEPPSNCVLELYRRKGDRKVQEVSISPDFQRSFVIAPGVHQYYMLVHCPGSSTYKTETYKLGSTRYLVNPINLGEIHLTRLKGE